jgi:inosine-uridine nucleoside N-ribohydrolase
MLRTVEREFILGIATSIFLGFYMAAGSIEANSAMLSIPRKLSQAEQGVYHKLNDITKQRKERGEHPRPIVVITDVGKDYDDLAALVILTEFHHIGLVEVRAVVANLMPAEERAHLAKAALDSLGVGHVPIACGTQGSPDDHEVLDHEFNGAEFSRGDSEALEDGQNLLLKVYQNAKERGEKLHLLCLSSLQDINEFAFEHKNLVVECTADVYMQGGNRLSKERGLEPDENAANNRFNIKAAKEWHSFIQTHNIPSHTYTKGAAFDVPLSSKVFMELEATGHPIGAYLRRVQVEQDLAFYKQACESDPNKRFAPFMDQKWFLANKTNWHASEGDNLPTGEEIIPHLTKIVLYDVHAALGIAGDDVVCELGALAMKKRPEESKSQGEGAMVQHWIYDNDNNNKKKRSLAISSLLKGALYRGKGGS